MSYSYSHQLATYIKQRHADDPEDLLFAVAALCVERDIVPSEIAARVGVSKQAVYDWLQHRYSPKPDTVAQLKAFHKELKKTKPAKG